MGDVEMQWNTPMPENPWPQDMLISVDDHPLAINQLLFVRHAWSIAENIELPPLSPAPGRGISKVPPSASIDEWSDRWRIAWDRAWDWYKIQDPDRTKHPTPELMREVLRPGQDLDPLIPPLWTTEYDWEGLDGDAFSNWQRDLSQIPPSDVERRVLPDLIPAWGSGMDTVIVVPFAGYFAKRITRRHLAVSASTRNSPTTYSRALRDAALS
jgi:hypothetical protein